MKKLYLIPLSHIICVSALQTQENNKVNDEFTEVFEGEVGEDDVINNTGQYKFVWNLFLKKPFMPNPAVASGVAN